MSQPIRRRSWLSLLPAAVLAFAALIALGTWQLQRKAWKEGLIATLNERLAEPPSALPAAETWPSLDRSSEEYRRVKFSAEFDHRKESLVYGAASAFRPDISGPGYWVFTPARLADGPFVFVNRGFVPEGRQDPTSRSEGEIVGPVEIVGAVRWPEARNWFSPADDPLHNLWFFRDPQAIADAKGIRAMAPFYVEQEAPVPPGRLPQPGKIVVNLRNEHLQYAVTWYGLAAVLVIIFVAWAFGSGREGHREGGRHNPKASRSL